MKSHPYAEIFPMMSESEIKELAEDIHKHGCRSPIITYEGKILDGRNRYQACILVGTNPPLKEFTGNNPLNYVISANIHRRHLTTSQRAMAAEKIAKLYIGDNQHTKEDAQICAPSQGDAAKKLKVSRRSVQSARRIAEASPEKAREVAEGKKSLHQAEKEIKEHEEPPEELDFVDETGKEIPVEIRDDWLEAEKKSDLLSRLGKIKSEIKAGLESQSPIWIAELNATVLGEVNSVRNELRRLIPYAVCPTCSGQTRDTCTMCRKRGWISKFLWDTTVAQEVKVMREKMKGKKKA